MMRTAGKSIPDTPGFGVDAVADPAAVIDRRRAVSRQTFAKLAQVIDAGAVLAEPPRELKQQAAEPVSVLTTNSGVPFSTTVVARRYSIVLEKPVALRRDRAEARDVAAASMGVGLRDAAGRKTSRSRM